MANQEQFRLVQQLAKDLQAGEIEVPSLPAVVLRIRELLDDENTNFEQVSTAVSADSALASRIFVFANSAYHNRNGDAVANLEAAIAKLGLDLVKTTSVALVVKQLARAQHQQHIAQTVRKVWARSMNLASMSYAVAAVHGDLNEETAFMCGLLHEVGKLYVLSKAGDIPGLVEDDEPICEAMDAWYSQIGRCIVECWAFPKEVIESMDFGEFLDEHVKRVPKMVDVVYVAMLMVDSGDEKINEIMALPACRKLGLNDDLMTAISSAYDEKLEVVRQTLS